MKIKANANWSTESRYALIAVTHGGKILAQTANKLTLYSSDLKELAELDLPLLQGFDEWEAVSSPTGESVLFRGKSSWIWVDTDSLKIVRSGENSPNGFLAITDDTMARLGFQPRSDPETGLLTQPLSVRTLSSEWRVIGPVPLESYRTFDFVDKDSLFLPGVPTRLIRTDGQVVFTEAQPSAGNIRWRGPVRSVEGRRFVAPGERVEGSVPDLDVSGHMVLKEILVYDLLSGGQPYILKLKGPKIKGVTKCALSPDGLRIAILNNETVEVFDLPPVQ